MDRLYIVLTCLMFIACSSQSQKATHVEQRFQAVEVPDEIVPIEKSADDWKQELSDFEFYVLRDKGTERAFTGDLWDNKKDGIYLCSACGLPLFDSKTKYKSGTGWPSFYDVFDNRFIKEDVDFLLGYKRTEIMCARCNGHLGHVFEDGPKPTGLRYCVNSISLDFVESEK